MHSSTNFRVAIITRTMNRPLLLERAFQSVRSQTFKDFLWVIINDGGEKECVNNIANKARASGINLQLIHNKENLGMEPSSNKAIRSCESEFIIIHDDDDSLEPTFLEKTIAFLDNNNNYKGVITMTTRMNEELSNDSYKIISNEPFQEGITGIYLADMVQANIFPPISFLYKREVYETIGYYDETLPVLADWDFNLRFLEKFDIGLIPEYLANYFFRINISNSNKIYGNTITTGLDKYSKTEPLLRNKYLRKDMEDNSFGLGWLMNQGHQIRQIRANCEHNTQLMNKSYYELKVIQRQNKSYNLLGIVHTTLKRLLRKS